MERLEDRRLLAGDVHVYMVSGWHKVAPLNGDHNNVDSRMVNYLREQAAINGASFDLNKAWWNDFQRRASTDAGSTWDMSWPPSFNLWDNLLGNPRSDKQMREDMLADMQAKGISDEDFVVVFGYSLGGEAVLKAARAANDLGIEIDLLGTIDPVSGGAGYDNDVRLDEAGRRWPIRSYKPEENVLYYFNRWQTNYMFPLDLANGQVDVVNPSVTVSDQAERNRLMRSDLSGRKRGCEWFDYTTNNCTVYFLKGDTTRSTTHTYINVDPGINTEALWAAETIFTEQSQVPDLHVRLGGKTATSYMVQTDADSQVFSWTAGGRSLKAVEYTLTDSNGEDVVDPGTGNSGSISFDDKGLGRFFFSIEASAFNPTGRDVTVKVNDDDSSAPTISLDGPAGLKVNRSHSNRFSDGDALELGWNIIDTSGLSATKVAVTGPTGRLTPKSWSSGSAPASGVFDLRGRKLGSYWLTASATDDDNDRPGDRESSNEFTYKIEVYDDDETSPTVVIENGNGKDLQRRRVVESHGIDNVFRWDVSDASGVSSVEVVVTQDGMEVDRFLANPQGEFDVNRFGPGVFRLEIDAYDADVDRPGDSERTLTWAELDVTNAAPIALAGGPYSVLEGNSLFPLGSGEDLDPGDTASLAYAWDLDNDGFFEQVSGASPRMDWATLVEAGINDDGTYPIALQVTDVVGASSVAFTEVVVENNAPTIEHISLADSEITEAGIARLTGAFLDASPADTHRAVIYWGDGSQSDAVIDAEARTFRGQHVYADDNPSGTDADTYEIRVEVVDDDGAVNPPSIQQRTASTHAVGEVLLPIFRDALPDGVVGTLQSAVVVTDPQPVDTSQTAAPALLHRHAIDFPLSGLFNPSLTYSSTESALGEHDHQFNVGPVSSKTLTSGFSSYFPDSGNKPYPVSLERSSLGTGFGADHPHKVGEVIWDTTTTFTYKPISSRYQTLVNENFGSIGSSFSLEDSGFTLNGNAIRGYRRTSRFGFGYTYALRLTDNVNSQLGSAIFNPGNQKLNDWRAEFIMTIRNGDMADGMSFVFGPVSNNSLFGEDGPRDYRGRPRGLVISFDTYPNGNNDVGISVFWAGNPNPLRHYTTDRNALRTYSNHKVIVDVKESGLLSLTHPAIGTKTVPLPNWNPSSSWNFGWGARTGGSNDEHWIDNVKIINRSERTLALTRKGDSYSNQYLLPAFNKSSYGTLRSAVATLDGRLADLESESGGDFPHTHAATLQVGPFSFEGTESSEALLSPLHHHAVDFAAVETSETDPTKLSAWFEQISPVTFPQSGTTLSTAVDHDHSIGDEQVTFDSSVVFTYLADRTSILVRNDAPVSTELTIPDAINEGDTLTLSGEFVDVGGLDTHTVTIDWGDGEEEVLALSAGQRSFAASHLYADDNPTGTLLDDHVVRIEIVDDDGGVEVIEHPLVVHNVSPTLIVGPGPGMVEALQEMSLPAVTFRDPGFEDEHEMEVDWGDGNVQAFTVAAVDGIGLFEASHAYLNPGTYLVSVTVSDDDGGSVPQTFEVDVINTAPSIVSASASAGGGPAVVDFSVNAIDSPADDLTFHWDFGDGQTFVSDPIGSSTPSFGHTVSHAFDTGGVYQVIVTASDRDGLIDSRRLFALASSVPAQPLVTSQSEATEGEPWTLSLHSEVQPGVDRIVQWAIDWGDGAVSTVSGSSASPSHVYADGPETVSVSILAMDEKGVEYDLGTLPISVVNQAPTVNSAISVSPMPSEGASSTFAVDVTDVASDVLTYTWDFGDGTSLSPTTGQSSVDHVFADDGTYQVQLTVEDEDGASTTINRQVGVSNVAPALTLDATATTSEGAVYELVLDGGSDPGMDSVQQWIVNWGDGNITQYDRPQIASHVYANGPSQHGLVIDLVDEDGRHRIAGHQTVTVQNAPPTIDSLAGKEESTTPPATTPTTTTLGLLAVAEGESLDNEIIDQFETYEGTNVFYEIQASDAGGDVLHYTWDFGDGSPVISGVGLTRVPHRFADNGLHTLVVTVVDEDGGQSVARLSILVRNVTPVVALGAEPSVLEGNRYALFLGSAADPGDDTVEEYLVDWGDGTTPQSVATAGTIRHTFADGDETRVIEVMVRDEDGLHSAGVISLHVENVAPVIASINAPIVVAEGGEFTVQTEIVDPGAERMMVSWDFGDGNQVAGLDLTSVSHQFADNGVYTIRAQVDDGDGGVASSEFEIVVVDVAPTGHVEIPSTIDEGETITLSLPELVDPGDDTIVGWEIDWGDGSISELAPEQNATHLYADGPLTTPVRVRVMDEEGAYLIQQSPLNVRNIAPTIDAFSGVASSFEGETVEFSVTASDAGAEDLVYTWDFGDGSVVQLVDEPSIFHTFADQGVYTVDLTVSDQQGGEAFLTSVVSVINVDPVVSLSSSPFAQEATAHTIQIGEAIDPGDDEIHTWILNWGDGNVEHVSGPGEYTHFFQDGPNDFTADLSIADEDGTYENIDSVAIHVANVPPTMSISGTTQIFETETAFIEFGELFDPGDDTASQIVIDWGDGYEDPYTGPGVLSHVYADGTQTYSVNVDVIDEDGEYGGIASWEIQVDNLDPTANPDAWTVGEDAGPTAIFVLENDWDPAGEHDPLEITGVDAVDTIGAVTFSTDSVFYETNGQFEFLDSGETATDTFFYTVGDGDGGIAAATVEVTIMGVNDAPVAVDDVAATLENTGLLIDALENDTDVDGDDNSTNFSIDSIDTVFVDGLTTGQFLVNGKLEVADGKIRFDPAGDFDELAVGQSASVTATYTMSDDEGVQDVGSLAIQVDGVNDPPVIQTLLSSADDPSISSADGVVSIDGLFSDLDLTDTHTVTIDWGDGSNAKTIQVDGPNSTFASTHTYITGGFYTITVDVQDTQGAVATRTTSAYVEGIGFVDGVVYIVGTDNRDHVNLIFHEKQDRIDVDVKLNQVEEDGVDLSEKLRERFVLSSVQQVVAYLRGGNDHFNGGTDNGKGGETVAEIEQIVFGGEGDDHLMSGSGNDVLSGGPGNDTLHGRAGRDVLIGGFGRDHIKGGDDEDLLVGGVAQNSNLADPLAAALASWSSGDLIESLIHLGAILDDEEEDDLDGQLGEDYLFEGIGDRLNP